MICRTCKNEKDESLFYKIKSGLQKGLIVRQCKKCCKDRINLWRKENPKQASINMNRIRRAWRIKNLIRERKKRIERTKLKRIDPKYSLDEAISSLIRKRFKRIKYRKSYREFNDTYLNILGYSFEDLKKNFEKKFKTGMSWNNYPEWEIDHIKPKYLFSLKQVGESWSINNLQPLWKQENILKNRQYNPEINV